MDKKFSIKVISDSCGVLPHTLRAWEARYKVFRPERAKNGQRMYSEQDLAKAKLLARLLECGHSISSLASYNNEQLSSMLELIKQNDANFDGSKKVNIEKLLKYLSDYSIELVVDELQHLRMSVGAKEFIFLIVLPFMKEVERLVLKGKFTVTQEHITSTVVRDQLSQIFLPNISGVTTKIALASPEGNLHELSIIIADILCRANRVVTHYLGAAHPPECLGQAINALKSPYLLLGTVSTDQWVYEKNITPYLVKVDSYLDREVEVILGGGEKIDFPEFKNIKRIKTILSLEELDLFLEGLG